MKKATTNETTFICVKPIIKAEYTIRIVGDSPCWCMHGARRPRRKCCRRSRAKSS